MQIINKPLNDLLPAPFNPRVNLEPDDPRYRKLKHSIERFGLVEPLVWNQHTGHLVGGHQRRKILNELGYDEAPVSVIDLEPGAEKALNVVLNNRLAQGDWDLPQLTTVLADLNELPESELSATGFDASHLKTLQDQLAPSDQAIDDETEGIVEILLRIPAAQIETIRPELDTIIKRYDLQTHIRHR